MSDEKPVGGVYWPPKYDDDRMRRAPGLRHPHPRLPQSNSITYTFTSGPDTPPPLKMSTSVVYLDSNAMVEMAPVLGDTGLENLVVTDEVRAELVGAEAKVLISAPVATIEAHGTVAAKTDSPVTALLLLDLLLGHRELTAEDEEGMAVDYECLYEARIARYGERRARLWLWFQAFRVLAGKVHLSGVLDACAKIVGTLKIVKDLFWPGN